MFNEILKDVPGIIDLQVTVMIFFLFFFIGTSIWALRANKSYIDKMRQMPLEPSNVISTSGENNNG